MPGALEPVLSVESHPSPVTTPTWRVLQLPPQEPSPIPTDKSVSDESRLSSWAFLVLCLCSLLQLVFVFLKLLGSPKAELHLYCLPPYLQCLAGHWASLVNGGKERDSFRNFL